MSKKLLTKRVEFPSIMDIVADFTPQFVNHFKLDEKQAEDMKLGLFQVLDRLMVDLEFAMKKGCEKGIEEAINLMKDADYYETVKKRKERARQEAKERLMPKKKDDFIDFFDNNELLN